MSNLLPLGSIVAMMRHADSPPPGWLYCNGATIDPDSYPDLAPLLTNNQLPNLHDRTIVGAGFSYVQGQMLGSSSSSTTLILENMPPHQHYGWCDSLTKDNKGVGIGCGTTRYTSLNSDPNTAFHGADGSDYGNYLAGSTWAGGESVKAVDGMTIPVTESPGYTWYRPTSNIRPINISVMQPSMAINYFIYARYED